MSQVQRAAYTRESWLRRWGKDDEGQERFDQQLPCDVSGCLFKAQNGYQVIFNTQSIALEEDCQRADILISAQSTPSTCTHPKQIIDVNNLRQNGAHSVYLTKNGDISVRSTRDVRGQRPWTIYGSR